VFTADRDSNIVHRQDETSGQMKTNFQQWDSNTSDTTGIWQWQYGDGSGGSLVQAMQLSQAGVLTVATLDIGGNVDIDGTTNLDEVDIDGAVDMASNLTLGGNLIFDGNTITGINDSGEFDDDDAHIMTSAAINDRFAQINANTTGSSGSCTGNAATATTATNATNATNVATTSVSNSQEYFGVFATTNGNTFQGLKVGAGLKYNPSTDVLTAGKLSSDTVDIVENAKTNAACMTITGAGAGTEANIGLKMAGTVHGSPIKLKMTAEDTEGSGVGAGILSYDPDSDTLNIGQSTTHNSMAISIDNNESVSINNRKFAVTSSTDGDFDGDVVYVGSTSTTVGQIYHYKSNGTWEKADADAASTCDGMLAVALGGNSTTNGMLLRGMVTLDHDPGNLGDVLFVSTTAGQATGTAPSGNGDIVRVIGYLLGGSNGQIYFNPDGTFVEVTA